jgi:hypothetical protein
LSGARERQAIVNGTLGVHLGFSKATGRSMMLWRLYSLLLKIRVFLFDHARFFYSNMFFQFVFHFEERLVKEIKQMFP